MLRLGTCWALWKCFRQLVHPQVFVLCRTLPEERRWHLSWVWQDNRSKESYTGNMGTLPLTWIWFLGQSMVLCLSVSSLHAQHTCTCHQRTLVYYWKHKQIASHRFTSQAVLKIKTICTYLKSTASESLLMKLVPKTWHRPWSDQEEKKNEVTLKMKKLNLYFR